MKGVRPQKIDEKTPVSVIILTLNEEANVEYCLRSVYGWSDDIHVIDSFSVDNTLKLAEKFRPCIHIADEAHWANLRNWALKSLPLKNEWVLFLDADEMLTHDLKEEISQVIKNNPSENGYYIKRRFFFMGKWLKYGGMYDKILRLFRSEMAEYIPEGDVEYARVEGKTGLLASDMLHLDRKGISKWVEKHNRIAERAAKQYLSKPQDLLKKQFKVQEIEGGRRTWVKYTFWDKIPLILRPGITFFYQYFLKFGFLDGLEGFLYAFLQAFWYRILIYVKVREFMIQDKIPPE